MSFDRLGNHPECKERLVCIYDAIKDLNFTKYNIDNELDLTISIPLQISYKLLQHILNGDIKYGYVIARPPSHHSHLDREEMFCGLNCVGIIATQQAR